MDSHTSPQQETGARRRAKMHERLISSAARVVAEMGEQRARIEDFITAAGVARGTFYNYYRTREELLDDLWARVGKEPFREIQLLSQSIEDPAERLAAEARLVLERAAEDHTWGWMVYAFSATDDVPADLLSYPRPDLVVGHRSGRFSFSNLDSASDLTVGALRSALRGILERGRSADYACAMIVLILKALGISEDEARTIAEKRLPHAGGSESPTEVRRQKTGTVRSKNSVERASSRG